MSERVESLELPVEALEIFAPPRDLQGRIHFHEGVLARKTAKLGSWKKGWYRVAPGFQQQHLYHLTQSKKTDLEKRILTFPKSNPSITVESVSSDPLSPNFTAFNVLDSKTQELLCTFRADDIVEQRNFMAALAGKGPGLFTQQTDVDAVTPDEASDGPANIDTGTELFQKQHSHNAGINGFSRVPTTLQSYEEVMDQLPKEFYFPDIEVASPTCPGELLPIYDYANPPPSSNTSGVSLCCKSRDIFHPPHGSPVLVPTIVGYGSEVGLKPHQQAVWDPDGKYYFFLDHKEKSTFIKDPRPQPKQRSTVETLEHLYGGGKQHKSLPFETCKEPAVINGAAERAAKKPHGFILKAAGMIGNLGSDGNSGEDGECGTPGIQGYQFQSQGGTGGDGFCGICGENGTRGDDGGPGSDVILDISGSAEELHISGTCNAVARLGGEDHQEIVFVDCHGGDGRDGGKGGDGGRGGDGADGGKGATGGDGGHGGDGGMGGDGGDGGNGGNAGSGGSCTIQTVDSQLLMLVEANCKAGTAGKGGSGGKPGDGGRGGFGGEGGHVIADVPSQENPYTLTLRGKPGMTGPQGEWGEPGTDGLPGRDGGILWVVKSANGEVLHRAGTRYDAEVVSMNVSTSTDNGIYEVNQRISVSNVTVTNSGGLPLPAGAKLFFPSSETVRFEPTVFTMPELAPEESFQVPITFHGRIADEPPPNAPGAFVSQAHFAPRIELLGRPFEKSILEQTLTVQYPIKLAFALSKLNVGRGEVTTLEVGVENISGLPFGTCHSSRSVAVQINMDSHLIPLGVIPTNSKPQRRTNPVTAVTEETTPSFTVSYGPIGINVQITSIQPGETMHIPIAVQLDGRADLFSSCRWEADLYLKGKLIEYMSSEIRASPAYSLLPSLSQLGDVLMVTSNTISQEEHTFWQKIFNTLEVNVDYWDSSYQKPLEEAESAAVTNELLSKIQRFYSGKLILYPHCNLNKLPAKEIVTHFHGNKSQKETGFHEDLNSSMVLFLSKSHSSSSKSLEDHFMKFQGDSKLMQHLCSSQPSLELPPGVYSGRHLLPPGTFISPEWFMKRAEKSTVKRFGKDAPSQAIAVVGHKNTLQSSGSFQYSYGSLDIRLCPLLCSCNFQCIDGAGGNMTARMGADDPLMTPTSTDVPLAGNFGQVFLATLSGLPLHCKVNLLKTADNLSTNSMRFHLPNGLCLTVPELAAICIASEVADEVLNCSGKTTRISSLVEDIQQQQQDSSPCKTSTPSPYSTLILQLVNLIKREVTDRRKKVNSTKISTAAREIKKLCITLTELVNTPHQVLLLPSLRVLQDRHRVLRTHQNTASEQHYDTSQLH